VTQAVDVRKRFGAIQTQSGLSLSVYEGEIYGLLEPNGSGKTTFIRCLAGSYGQKPDACRYLDRHLGPVSAGRLGYMTHAPAPYGELTVDENLRFFAALQAVTDVDRHIEESLRTVDLLDRRRSLVGTLSERRRETSLPGRGRSRNNSTIVDFRLEAA
jgi:ABC-2 type transport system ATP-binding protein